ncbi:MAG: PAS domain-containing protein [Anaerolineae bacterium]|nr:PAS domain-containing protein [Anaerolineae bacterium]
MARDKEDKSLNIIDHQNGHTKVNGFERFFDLSLDMLCIIDRDGYFKHVNSAFEHTLGWSAQDLLAKPFVEFLHADDVAEAENAVKKFDQNAEIFQFECRFVCQNGLYKWLVWKVQPTQDETGYAVVRDVTIFRQTEAALEGSEARFHRFVSSLGDHIYVTEFTTKGEQINQYISPNVESLTGHCVEKLTNDWEFWGQTIIHPDDKGKAARQAKRFSEGLDSEIEYRIVHADGRVIWVRDSGRVEVDAQNRSLIVYGVVSDITSRKVAEEQLKQREERTSLLNKITAQVSKDPREQLSEALGLTLQLLDLDIGIISQVEGTLYTIKYFYAPNVDLEKGQTFELGDTYCNITLQANGIIAIDHMQVSRYRQHPCYGIFKLEAYIGIPIVVHNNVYGTLNFSSSTPKTFTSADRDFLKLLASWVGAVIERIQAEETLQDSEARLSEAQRMAKLGTWDWDIRKNQVVWSDQLYEILGVARSTNVSNELYQDLIHPDDKEQVRRALDNSLKSERTAYEFEHRLVRRNGEVRYIAGISRIQRDKDNQPIRMIGVAQDVTERKLAEETIKKQNVELTLREDKLRQNVEKLQATQNEMSRVYAELKQQSDQMGLVQQVARIGAWEISVDSHAVQWNDMMFDIFRMPKREQPPELYELTEFIHPDDRELYKTNLQLLLRQGVRLDQEMKLLKDEEVVHVYVAGLAQFDSRQKVTKVFGLFQDITKRKQVEETLRESEASLSEAQQIAKLGTWTWDIIPDKILWSDQFCKIFGVDPDILPDFDTFQRLIHPDDRNYVVQTIQDALQSGAPSYTVEHRIICEDGQEKFIAGIGHVDFSKEGQPVKLIGVAQDITDQKRSEAVLAKQARELETVSKIATTVSTISEPNLMLQTVVDLTKDNFNLDHVQIYLFDETGEQLTLSAASGNASNANISKNEAILLDDHCSLIAQVARERRGITVNSIDGDSIINSSQTKVPSSGSELAVPIMTGEQVLGVLVMRSAKLDEFADEHVRVEMTLASQVAVALQNARSFEKSEIALQELNALTRRLTREGWDDFLDYQQNSEVGYFYDLKQLSPLKKTGISTNGEIAFDYPLVTQGEIIGQLELTDPQLPDEDALEIVEAVAARLSTHLENLRLSEQTQRALMEQQQARLLLNKRVKELNCLSDIGRKISEAPSIIELLMWIADRIPSTMQYPELCQVAIQYQGEFYGSSEAVQIPSQIVSTLSVEGKIVGKIYIAYKEKRAFLDEESTLLGGIATRVSSYLETRYLFDQTQSALASTEALYMVGQVISRLDSAETIMQDTAAVLVDQLGYESSWLAIINEKEKTLDVIAGAGQRITERLIRQRYSLEKQTASNTLVSNVLDGKSAIINDVMNDDRAAPLDDLVRANLGRMLQVPILISGRVVGVISASRPMTKPVLTEQDLNLVGAIADQVSIGLRNIKDIERTQSALEEARVFRQLVEASGQGIGMATLAGDITYVNSTMAHILDESDRQAVRGENFMGYYPQNYQQFMADTVIPSVMEQGQWTGETVIQSTHGKKTPVIENLFLIRDEVGEPLYIADVITDITERKRTEEALQRTAQENSQLVTAINSAAIGVTISDATQPDNPLIFINPAFTSITGYAAEDVLGKNCRFLQGADTDPEALTKIRQAIDEERSITVELLNYRKDGTAFWNELSINPIFDEYGNLVNFVGIQFDVTLRKQGEIEREQLLVETQKLYKERSQAEQTLRENEERLSEALELSKLGYWEFDVASQVFTFNDPFYSIFRTTAEQEGGYTMSVEQYAQKFVHPDDMHLVGEGVQKTLETNDPNYSAQLEHRMMRADGELGYISVQFSIEKDRQGNTTKLLGINQDITERKLAEIERERLLNEQKETEQILRENEERLSEALETAKLGYWEFDVASQMFTFNDPFYSIFRTTAKQEDGYTMSVEQYAQRFVHPDDVNMVGEETQKSIETTDPNYSARLEHRIIRADGQLGYISVQLKIEKDSQGKTTKTLGINQDITENKVAEIEREQLLEEVEEAYRQYVRGEWEKFLGDYGQDRLQIELNQVNLESTQASKEALLKTRDWVAQSGKPKVLLGAGENGHSTEPAIVAPISLRGETIGTLSLQDIDPNRHWTSEEIALVETVSEQLALTIENLRLFDDTQRQATREQLTRKIADKMRASPDIETIIETGLTELADVLKVPRTYVKLVSDMSSTKEADDNEVDNASSK